MRMHPSPDLPDPNAGNPNVCTLCHRWVVPPPVKHLCERCWAVWVSPQVSQVMADAAEAANIRTYTKQ